VLRQSTPNTPSGIEFGPWHDYSQCLPRVPPGSGMQLAQATLRRRLKHNLGLVLFQTGLYRRFFRDQAVVVLFHRVDDRYPTDPLTCTARKFAAFCDFFARYFTVVPLSELVRRVAEGRSVGGLLSVTFDDGYRDNSDTAAGILKQQGLPACFFVATDLIGSSQVAWWDAAQRIESRWMSWDDLRGLVAAGFEVGSHTVHHEDLGRMRGAMAYREMAESKRRLEAELSRPITLFSYPYGGAAHLHDSNRELARQVGYHCCLSAHGGLVPRGTDPFHMQRTPISHWQLSPYQFGFEAALESLRDGHHVAPRVSKDEDVGRSPALAQPDAQASA